MKQKFCLLSGLLVVAASMLKAELVLKPIHRDEAVEYTLTQRFSLENAVDCMKTIRDCLDSFRRLTEAAKGKLAAGAWKNIGHTDWDTQALGFRNLPASVEGALRYQDYLLKKALCQLAVLEAEAKRAPLQKAEQARLELARSEGEFQAFWETLTIAD